MAATSINSDVSARPPLHTTMSTSGQEFEIDVTPASNRSAASRDGSQPSAGDDVGDAKRHLTLERNSSSGSQEASVSRNASSMTTSTPSLSAVGRNVCTIFGSGPAANTVAVASHGDETSSAAWRWPSAVSPHVEGGVAASTADRQCRTRTTRTPSEYGGRRLRTLTRDWPVRCATFLDAGPPVQQALAATSHRSRSVQRFRTISSASPSGWTVS
jgi:hypothetical protein